MITSKAIAIGQSALIDLMDRYPEGPEEAVVELGIGPRSLKPAIRTFIAPTVEAMTEYSEEERAIISDKLADWTVLGFLMGVLTDRFYSNLTHALLSSSSESEEILEIYRSVGLESDEAIAEIKDLVEETSTRMGNPVDVDSLGDSLEEVRENAIPTLLGFVNHDASDLFQMLLPDQEDDSETEAA
jgi:hypothetical protein